MGWRAVSTYGRHTLELNGHRNNRSRFSVHRPRSFDRIVVDSHVTIVRAGTAVEPAYLYNFIRSPAIQDKIEDMQSGSTNQVELNRSEIIATRVPLPPLPEQRRIVAKVDGLTARTARARKELDRISCPYCPLQTTPPRTRFFGRADIGWRAELFDELPAANETLARIDNDKIEFLAKPCGLLRQRGVRA